MPHRRKGEIKVTTRTLWNSYRELFYDVFGIQAPLWNIKDWKNWSRLVEELGFSNTEVLYNFSIFQWMTLKDELNLRGYPTVGLLWGYRHAILDIANDKNEKRDSAKKEGKQRTSTKKLFLSK